MSKPTEAELLRYLEALSNGDVPNWNPYDMLSASAYVKYLRSLSASNEIGLVESKSYAVVQLDATGRPLEDLQPGQTLIIPKPRA